MSVLNLRYAAAAVGIALSTAGCASQASLRAPAEIAADVTDRALDRSKLGLGQSGNVVTETRQVCRTVEPGFVAGMFGASAKEDCGEKLIIVRSAVNSDALAPQTNFETAGIPDQRSLVGQPLKLTPNGM